MHPMERLDKLHQAFLSTYNARVRKIFRWISEEWNHRCDKMSVRKMKRKKFIMMYLATEQWFHTVNPKKEVHTSILLISRVLCKLKNFPSHMHKQGHNISILHGMAKMRYDMCLFEYVVNFFGGPEEYAHILFLSQAQVRTLSGGLESLQNK